MPKEEMQRIGKIGRANGGGVYERTPEIKAKIAASLRGRKASDQQRTAISAGLKSAWDRGERSVENMGLPKGYRFPKKECSTCGRMISSNGNNWERHCRTHKR